MDITHVETIIICEILFLPVWVFDEVRGTLQHLSLPVSLSVRSETEKYIIEDHMGLVPRKLVFRVSDKVSFKPVSSASEIS